MMKMRQTSAISEYRQRVRFASLAFYSYFMSVLNLSSNFILSLNSCFLSLLLVSLVEAAGATVEDAPLLAYDVDEVAGFDDEAGAAGFF